MVFEWRTAWEIVELMALVQMAVLPDCCLTLGDHTWLCIIQGALLGKSAPVGTVSMGHLDKGLQKYNLL